VQQKTANRHLLSVNIFSSKQASLAARQAAAYKKHEEASGYFVSVQMDR
jgi:hypothetical protein